MPPSGTDRAACPGYRAPGSRRYRRDVYRRFTTPGWIAGHVLVLAAVLTCLRLGWWQWDRTHEASGTAQNFGYALLWPAFGAAFVYMWLRFLHLELLKDAEDSDEDGDRRGDADQHAAAELQDELAELLGPTADADVAEVRAADLPAETPIDEPEPAPPTDPRQRPSTGVTIAVSTVGDEDDDPELTAYNRALAALAEEDHRRGR